MALIRVFEIPPPTSHYHFAKGEPQAFIEVDWFSDDHFPLTKDTIPEIKTFVSGKRYFNPTKAYLVLHPEHSFTIGYDAP